VRQVRNQNIGLIYCVGENAEERENEQGEEVIHAQLEGIKDILNES